jgi:hypothetical protein
MFAGELDRVQFASCKHGNEKSASIKDWKFLVQLSDHQLLKEDQHFGETYCLRLQL